MKNPDEKWTTEDTIDLMTAVGFGAGAALVLIMIFA